MHPPKYLMRLFVCYVFLASSVYADIATQPQTSQSLVAPNLVVTLDDSGSMHDECVPGALCINSSTNVGSVFRPMVHPPIAAIPYKPSGSTSNHPLFTGVLTYDLSGLSDAEKLVIVKQRSSDFMGFNTYYDPKVRYKPWVKADDNSTLPNASISARFNPNVDSETMDLRNEVTHTAKFCTSPTDTSTCRDQSQTFKPAQYYVLTPGRSGDQLTDFTQVIIADGTLFTKASARDDCAGRDCTKDEELQNFANWFSYSRVASKYAGDALTFFPASYDTTSLYGRQMHSSAINLSYYNPTRRYRPWLNADGSYYPNASTSAAPYDPNSPAYTLDLTQEIRASEIFCVGKYRNQCEASTQTFYPAQYYELISGDGTALAHFRQVVINTTSSFAKAADRSDCLGIDTCTQTEELKNFANWFTYYRTKWLAAKAAISQTFAGLPSTLRLGYGVISVPTSSANIIDGVATGTLQRGVRTFDGTSRSQFYDWLLNLRTAVGAGTPLRRAMVGVGNYYRRTDNAGPWGEIPGGSSTADHKICRRALHMLITDGAWTGSIARGQSLTEINNVVGAPGGSLVGVNVDGSSAFPWRDGTANTLADVAMHYWTNLRPDLSGTVSSPQAEKDLGRNANWPHMVNYMIGFGVSGTLANPADSEALKAGTKTWPAPVDENSKIDDLWHAAWNSGGLSFSANDPLALSTSLGTIIESINQQSTTDAAVILPSRFISSDYVYVPSYAKTRWSGDLMAYTFDRSIGDRAKKADGSYADATWSAANKLDALSSTAIAARKIYTLKGAARFEFTYTNLTTQGLIPTLTSDSTEAADLINFLRGDRTKEGSTYRRRASRLGDIVNSSPLLVYNGEDNAYDFLPPPADGSTRGDYRTYLLHKTKRKGLVFVGANDGMLHAFDSITGDEIFAYIPKTVLGNLKLLSNTEYAHRYFVDGPLVEADVYDQTVTPTDSDTGWRNIVVGTGGAGGKNMFAIKVPVVSTSNANTLHAPGASDILWEINADDAGFSGLGHVMQKPAVGRMRDGTWVVIAGNGYVNSGGTAKLYIINALTGALIKTISPSVSSMANNGLGGVRLVLDLNRQITGAYAGDLLGNLWKFDFSDTDKDNWALAFGGKPLFKAQYSVTQNGITSTQAQAITAAPGYLAHPQGGNLVIFGSGKLFDTADTDNTDVQSLYAVWDKVPTGESSAATTTTDGVSTSVMVAPSSLVEQQMTAIYNTDFFTATNNLVNYTNKRGWFINLNMSPAGLRFVFEPQFAVGKVFMQTLSPKGGATDACSPFTGKTVNFVLNGLTGSSSSPTFDLNQDGKIDSLDAVDSAGNPVNAVAFVSKDTGRAVFTQRVGFSVSSGVVTNAVGQKILIGTKNMVRRTWRQIIRRPSPA